MIGRVDMNKFKLVILSIFILFLCGCNANYELNIKDNNVTEKLELINTGFSNQQIEVFTTNPLPIDKNIPSILGADETMMENQYDKLPGVKYYDINAHGKDMTVTGEMTIEEYKNSFLASQLFNSVNVNNYDNFISIYGYDGLFATTYYSELNKVNVKITTDKEVIEHDADQVEGNTYIWHFDKDTPNTKTLYIKMDSSKVTKEKKEKAEAQFSWILVGVFLGVFAFIIFGILLVILVKGKINNKI